MEDSSKERPRCPCGFWGTQQTLGLCSKCYCEAQKNKSPSTSDSSKPPIGSSSKSSLRNFHSQQARNESGSVTNMDSKHFPSHSTTDNLPSSLSTPGERQLNAAPPSTTTVDTQVTTTGTNTDPSLASGGISTEDNDLKTLSDTSSSRSMPSQLIASSSESSSLSDPTYDPENLITSSSTSVVSVPLSTTSSLTGLHSPLIQTGQESSSQSDVTVTLPNTSAVGPCATSASSSVPTSCVVTKLPCNMKDIPCINLVSSSTKDISVKCDGKDQARSIVSPKDKEDSTVCDDNSSQSPLDRGIKRSREEMEGSSSESLSTPSPQKNKKRCFTCSCKLELAQRTIGRCRCDRVFCSLHRLPELHKCDFNHKEDGRREAREKMIKPTRHLGTSFRRDDNL